MTPDIVSRLWGPTQVSYSMPSPSLVSVIPQQWCYIKCLPSFLVSCLLNKNSKATILEPFFVGLCHMHSNPSREIILGEREIALFEAELLYLSYFGIPLPFTMLNLTYVQFDHS